MTPVPPLDQSPRAHSERRGEGLLTFLIHGNGVDHQLMLPLDKALDTHRLERVYVDLPGFGGTPALPGVGGLQDLADWLVAQVAELAADRPFALIGSSLGGLLARHIRAEMPDQVIGMALLAPVVDPDPSRRTLPAFAGVERDDNLLANLDGADREEFTTMAARQTPASWELFRRFVLPSLQTADPDAMHRLSAHYALTHDPEAVAGPFTGPAVVITGKQDHIVGYSDQHNLVRAWFPNATYAALEGTGHNTHLDCPETVHALLSEWARQLPH